MRAFIGDVVIDDQTGQAVRLAEDQARGAHIAHYLAHYRLPMRDRALRGA